MSQSKRRACQGARSIRTVRPGCSRHPAARWVSAGRSYGERAVPQARSELAGRLCLRIFRLLVFAGDGGTRQAPGSSSLAAGALSLMFGLMFPRQWHAARAVAVLEHPPRVNAFLQAVLVLRFHLKLLFRHRRGQRREDVRQAAEKLRTRRPVDDRADVLT
jgi:hypothetical protein